MVDEGAEREMRRVLNGDIHDGGRRKEPV